MRQAEQQIFNAVRARRPIGDATVDFIDNYLCAFLHGNKISTTPQSSVIISDEEFLLNSEPWNGSTKEVNFGS